MNILCQSSNVSYILLNIRSLMASILRGLRYESAVTGILSMKRIQTSSQPERVLILLISFTETSKTIPVAVTILQGTRLRWYVGSLLRDRLSYSVLTCLVEAIVGGNDG